MASQCVCKSWCRSWEETQGGKYPPSDHAPGCDQYRQEAFARIELDGSSCIVEPHEVADVLGDDPGEYDVSTVLLTSDQFERMPEFTGF